MFISSCCYNFCYFHKNTFLLKARFRNYVETCHIAFIWGLIKTELKYFTKVTIYYILYTYENKHDMTIYMNIFVSISIYLSI